MDSINVVIRGQGNCPFIREEEGHIVLIQSAGLSLYSWSDPGHASRGSYGLQLGSFKIKRDWWKLTLVLSEADDPCPF